MNTLKVEDVWIRDIPIGRGSNGTVSLAVQKSGGGVFAVKSVDISTCLPHQLEALENEIKILQTLSSPYVVGYLGNGVTGEPNLMRNLYMEYLPGGSLADMARNLRHVGGDHVVDETAIQNFSFCIVSALSYLHSKGIVHCDVKGANVLMDSSFASAKLADFGSSVSRSELAENEIFSEFRPRGSPLWMAPEAIRGEYQGPESDVWSLGCTVIEMITGKPAWEDKGSAETLLRIGYSDELPNFPTQLSESGRDFLHKCLQRKPEQRWSCDQLLKHPFLSFDVSCSKKLEIHPTPRSILEFFCLDSDEEDEESVPTDFPFPKIDDNERIGNFKQKVGIKELMSGPEGPVWESDGWVAVRNFYEENEVASISGAEESTGVEGETQLASAEFASDEKQNMDHDVVSNSVSGYATVNAPSESSPSPAMF